MSQYHCAEAEREGGCRCAQVYESGMDVMGTDGTGYIVSFTVKPRELIELARDPCGRADLDCAFTVSRDPNAQRLFIDHSPGYGFHWHLLTNPTDWLDPDPDRPGWRHLVDALRPIVHAEIDRQHALASALKGDTDG